MRMLAATILALALASAPALAQSADERGDDSDAIGELTFASGSTAVKDAELARVDRIASWHANNPNALIIIEGFASRGGGRGLNLRLSQERTDAVRDALIGAGADSTRMVLIAHPTTEDGARNASPRVVIRATGAFEELVREQRDARTVADTRAARRTTARREASTPRGRGDLATEAAPPAAPPAQAPTVVIVQSGAPRPDPYGAAGTETGPAVADAGGFSRTSGGDGTSARTGIGMDPTDPVATGGAGFTRGVFGLPAGIFGEVPAAEAPEQARGAGRLGVGIDGTLGPIQMGTGGAAVGR